MKQRKQRILSFLLSGAVFLSMQTAFVKAEIVDYQKAAQANAFQNPVHHCINEGQSEWSRIYFGSYPQSEIQGKDLTEEIVNAAYDENGDADVGDDRYRRMDADQTSGGEISTNAAYRYFKWEPIRWRVLENNGETFFLMADVALDYQPFNESSGATSWESCTLRAWLNEEFYNTAFDEQERADIVAQQLDNSANPDYESGTDGESTIDNIYLLSYQDALNTAYGFCQANDCSPSRRLQASAYAKTRQKPYIQRIHYFKENCSWRLRSPGRNSSETDTVSYDGIISSSSCLAVFTTYACTPALRLNASSALWHSLPEKESTQQRQVPANPVHHCHSTDSSDWSYIYFGSYPQTKVPEEEVTNEITGANYDASVGGNRYRKYLWSAAPYTYIYLKWEPIKWRVLHNDGKTLTVVSDKILDSKPFNTSYSFTPWRDCTLRTWLNEDFYHAAFNEEEKKAIVEQILENPDHPYTGSYGGGVTKDKVYLLTFEDVHNTAYGFCPNQVSPTRKLDSTMLGTSFWWLRSPDSDARWGSYVTSYSNILGLDGDGNFNVTFWQGCVPVVTLSLADLPDSAGGQANVKVQKIAIDMPSKKLAAGKKVKLTAGITPSNAANQNVIWTSSQPAYASIDQSGILTLKKAGAGKSVTITATAADGGGAKASCKISIQKSAVKSIKLSIPKKTVKAGRSVKLKADIKTTGKNANKTLKWSSSNKNYATVDQKGRVKTNKAGKKKKVKITAMSTDGSNKKASITISIR